MKESRPHLNFYYSFIYDKNIHEWKGKNWKNASKRAIKYIAKLRREWNKVERKVFNAVATVSGLRWRKPYIDCYITQIGRPFSMPLTISMKSKPNPKDQIEVLIHELIHNVLAQNSEKVKIKKYKKYGKLTERTKIHILVHAILKEVLVELFGEKKTKAIIRHYDKWPDYKKAWEIVEREGSGKIIKESIR